MEGRKVTLLGDSDVQEMTMVVIPVHFEADRISMNMPGMEDTKESKLNGIIVVTFHGVALL